MGTSPLGPGREDPKYHRPGSDGGSEMHLRSAATVGGEENERKQAIAEPEKEKLWVT